MEVILVTAAIIFLIILIWSSRIDSRLPPFPRKPLPIVGNLFHMEADPRSQFKAWRKQCGDIFSFKIVNTIVVVLNGYDVFKEAFVKKADSFSDRTPVFFDEATGLPAKGVMFSSGDSWREQRTVALAILRKFGMGKNILAEKIQEEASAYVNYLASQRGEPIDIKVMANICTSNVICSMVIGHRFEYDDKEFRQMIAYLNFIAADQKNVTLINFLPWLKYLPGDLFNAKRITRDVIVIFDMLKSFIFEKGQNDHVSSETTNFIQAYNVEKDKKLKSEVPTYMDDENLQKIVLDLFAAGTETTSNTIYWFVLYMLNFPHVQEKVYGEIKDIVGTERAPVMLDRPKMPYLNAAILETQRLGSVVPLSLTHMCSKEATLKGYTIPKGAFIVPNLDSVLHDKNIWGEDVMTFKPERFLDTNGKLQNREELIPFGIGRRVCLGEALANMELFLFLTNMLQRFQFLPKDKVPPDCTRYIFGIACSPINYEVRMVNRK